MFFIRVKDNGSAEEGIKIPEGSKGKEPEDGKL
jgi:hypothetical protein